MNNGIHATTALDGGRTTITVRTEPYPHGATICLAIGVPTSASIVTDRTVRGYRDWLGAGEREWSALVAAVHRGPLTPDEKRAAFREIRRVLTGRQYGCYGSIMKAAS